MAREEHGGQRFWHAAPATLEALLRAYEMTGEPGWMHRADRSLPLLGGLPFLRTAGFNCDTRARCSIFAPATSGDAKPAADAPKADAAPAAPAPAPAPSSDTP